MGTVQRAIKMIQRNRKEALAYVATLSVSTSLLFLFVNVQKDANFLAQAALLDVGKQQVNNLLGGSLTLIIIAVCFTNTFIVNSYYNRSKSQELSVYLSSGMNIAVLSEYLIVQNFILLFFSLVIGGALGCGLHIGLNALLHAIMQTSGPLITLTWQGVLLWVVILAIELVYLIMLNAGFAYKAELKELMNNDASFKVEVKLFKVPGNFFLILAGLGAAAIWISPSDMNFMSVCVSVFLCGVYGYLHSGYPAKIQKRKRSHKHMSCKQMLTRSNLLELWKQQELYVLLLMTCMIGMCVIYPALRDFPYLQVLAFVAYELILIVMAISIDLKIIRLAQTRRIPFHQLILQGCTKQELLACIHSEMVIFFAVVFILPLIPAGSICIRFLQNGTMVWMIAAWLLCSYMIVILCCAIGSVMVYRKQVFLEEENDNEVCD